MKKRTVLVTGAAGFIGSNLCRRLLEDGCDVVGLDNFSEGERANLKALESRPGFELVEGDIRDPGAVDRAMARATHVVHLAAKKIPRYGNGRETLEVNALGSIEVMKAASRRDCRTVLASTSDCYGKNPHLPFSEYGSDNVIGHSKVRRWAYAVSKLFEEHFAFCMHEEEKFRVSVVRYFGGYGPFQHRGWLGGPQSVFFELARKGESLTIHGDGLQQRTFTFVDDMVEGTIQALFQDRAIGDIYNIGAEKEITIRELARLCWSIARKDEPKLVFQPYESFGGNYEDVKRRVPDNRRAKEELGFAATVEIEDGLRRTWEWLVKHRFSNEAP